MEKIRVIVADSQPVMRRLLGRRLAASACIELAGLVADERGLVRALGQGVCDVVALRFPLGNGNDACSGSYARLGARLAALGRQRVVAIANNADRAGVLQLIKDGCRNVVTALDHADEVVKAVGMAHLDLASVSEIACDLIWGRRCRGLGDYDDWAELLTTRESEVLRLYLSGLSVTEIAVRTGRTVKTISTQKQSVMRKVGADNDVELAAFAIQRGML
ncbi:response regulator in two-component regulatory system, transcriptional regulator LuxR [Cupriavidus taiwanensis]|uniref:Response regulator in two-component regulatory system, transcriptional regulator LuxR n=2 Tax=Cupriavidus taiwanensis TaxID=164546 RepID=A0A375J9J0_9BURK|nr:response regulator in two-component regulatory system, transcriptional regulator LuxR [Cupriavidus taiwanensis]